MFNVCPSCGEYTDQHEIRTAPARTVCPECSHEHEFVALPLFVVTGASGSGKTTAALQLARETNDFVVLDQDILWNDSYNAPGTDFRLFRNTWLRMAKNIHQAGKSVVLFGSAIPEQYEQCNERRYVSEIRYLALVCNEGELERRLRARPAWRASGSDENVQRMQGFNKWLMDNAAATDPPMSLLDTSDISESATAVKVLEWLRAKGD